MIRCRACGKVLRDIKDFIEHWIQEHCQECKEKLEI
jgi:phage FluMu protein Com